MDISVFTNKFGPNKIEKDKDLFPYLTLRTHVIAPYFFEAETKGELVSVLTMCLRENVPYILIGGGSNTAIITKEIRGLTIKNSYSELKLIHEEKTYVELSISSGYSVSLLVSETVEKGWGGFEYHKGLPGTMGGGVYMNSKWTRPLSYIGDRLISAQILDKKGRLKLVERDYFQFGYDFSTLQKTGEIFIDGIFRLEKTDPNILKRRADESLSYRKKTQPFGVATCGCFFQNISKADQLRLDLPTTSVGYLIDKAGMKNLKIGAFSVSNLHANFILHSARGDGKTQDLLQLISEIKRKVKERFGVTLIEEVVVI
ncbi:hypothetical protein A2334_02090 [Candidatus Roizmanbacteria bacterium RIFOXYB2_FULL_38_10]|uniref:UDP-N-acetylenolpyruvoylglucosamine reductase n=1 Tax=Candidatus Roizmanbacteria bacterium RIFOXYD1_FULL_38_12 TaxID=1802093 RepID=A0A1F7L0A9_9BACT|nr:MAG: hypothetical protein A3K47_01875 [Candidatus Roizmanbacteria bacterium RIFOXYA2_FULL_38_14]OGK63528.1 MAG: hypothetical protein A3K27_01875 [Candidatus Roizmanbacteria bacterium RIFOXYA1_FULL_37_12]OGK65374.1 MAG: hypothetical protein A3K38_01875 [Candidatus Roizmanbacteria bacterium RIFOXYB1_FULL_40_23]OGK67911.1 MAG: hypothetical protein A2334_02090 [Candidatus Roizmanbacteria bacterium RIFOXYB2_FULL_38_10]OGK69779.1 MAG: hypothetical protein A3K21_01880 [Candidatus Roizmanbacteria ba